MTETTKTLYDALKRFWAIARDRRYKFFNDNGKQYLSCSMDSVQKNSKLTRADILNGLNALKDDDRIDFVLCDYEGRECLRYTNGW